MLLSPGAKEPGAACVCARLCVYERESAVSLAQMGLWNDKALQDVFTKSALTPPITFYGPEGEVHQGY